MRGFAESMESGAEWPQAMVEAGLPRIFVLCIFLLSYTGSLHQGSSDIDALELFAGDRMLTRALQRRCLVVVGGVDNLCLLQHEPFI